jgi:hypothetical protein
MVTVVGYTGQFWFEEPVGAILNYLPLDPDGCAKQLRIESDP